MSTQKVLLLLLGLLSITLFSVLAVTADSKQSMNAVAIENPQAVPMLEPRASCTMSKTSGAGAFYLTTYQAGTGTYTYFNPSLLCPPPPTYPFEINAFSFTLYDWANCVWPALVDVVVYTLAQPPNSCSGPGAELCRYSVTADEATFGYPHMGTYTFPTPCCVNAPFYIGLEYRAGTAGSTPAITFDALTSVNCDNWMLWTDGLYYECNGLFTPPRPGYPLFRVGGETVSPNCGGCYWQPGDAYKMHFPQLPNEAGWDVNATAPILLADDWQCSQTGMVKDIHFWGSWKNGVVGRILYFVLSVRADIPANPPQVPYSRPGAPLWERDIAKFTVTQVDPPTLEGWYDPSTDQVLPNDHGAYFQYDICLDEPDWFGQEQGTIYWLNISAVVEDPQNTQWGWKSTLNHFNDDAVWLQGSQSTCTAPDNGSGTIDFPADCPYGTGSDAFHIIDGLPPGSQVNAPGELADFFNVSRTPGGPLGGESVQFKASLYLQLSGSGGLSGYSRPLTIPIEMVQMDLAARGPGSPQSFACDLFGLQGQLPPGDPDFDLLRITGGSGFGLPSPGHTTLTLLPHGHWNIDSFFDITYRIDFVGAPGGPLAGMSGSTTSTVRIQQGGPVSSTWADLWEPSKPILNQFNAQVDPQGMLIGGGTDYFGQGWYRYESGWWNIWFYDHPFTYDRGKVIRMELFLDKMAQALPSRVVVAVNWATDRWSLVPQQDSMPPLPGFPEQLYIGRDTLLVGEELTGHYAFDYVLRDYNPEWVSVDVIGSNVMLEGSITHDCRQSLDLSFVITSFVGVCDCKPGDANFDHVVDISDVVYLIAYIFSGGSAPKPYAKCSGDANKDCSVDISDVVYLIAYIFSGGNPPCTCQQWMTKCGPPLRK